MDHLRVVPRLVHVMRARRPHVLDARLGLLTSFGLLAGRLARVPAVAVRCPGARRST